MQRSANKRKVTYYETGNADTYSEASKREHQYCELATWAPNHSQNRNITEGLKLINQKNKTDQQQREAFREPALHFHVNEFFA